MKIATAIEKGHPQGVFAKYAGISSLRVDPVIGLAGSGSHRSTTSVVEVSSGGGGAVTLRMPKNSLT